MKNFYLLLLTILLSFSFSNAQNNVAWEEVALNVESSNAGYVLNLMDDFYSSIEMINLFLSQIEKVNLRFFFLI